jgi:hypothetical protein
MKQSKSANIPTATRKETSKPLASLVDIVMVVSNNTEGGVRVT